MKLGFGFYRHLLTPENFAFARQAGATHAVVHLVDYFNQGCASHNSPNDQPSGNLDGWGIAGDPNVLWQLDDLLQIKKQLNDAGLKWEVIENFDPAHWFDVLLDGPQKKKQLEGLKTIIRTVGEAGIPTIGYNFSLAGVCGRIKGNFARGNAEALGMDGVVDDPVPLGMVWNMWYDTHAPKAFQPAVTLDQLWQRLDDFLDTCLPVAEASGVRLAAHPDDPPMPTMRGTPRLVYQPKLYQRLLDIHPSPSNALEFCLGTLSEMTDGDIYQAVDQYSKQNAIAYIHFRNVRGKVPHYQETFVDEGDIDMLRVLKILKKNNFQGVLIPDHTPQMTCNAPWHAGMAYSMGYMQAALKSLQTDAQAA